MQPPQKQFAFQLALSKLPSSWTTKNVLHKNEFDYPGRRRFSWLFSAWESCERATKQWKYKLLHDLYACIFAASQKEEKNLHWNWIIIWVIQLTFKKATQNEQLMAMPPYGHLVITATLFWPEQKLSQSLCLVKEPFSNTDSFLWFVGVQINEIPLCFLSLITIQYH